MSHDSSSKSSEAPRAAAATSASASASSSSSKAERYDVYDANIRNFAPVARIMKNALPENAKIAKEAKECMQECVSEFISFITSEGELTHIQPCLRRAASRASEILTYHSVGEVPSGEEENREWGRYPLCHDVARVRELRRGVEDLPLQVS